MGGRSSNNLFNLQKEALNRIEPLLDALKIEWVQRHNDYINIICPVHGSADLGSSCIYLSNGAYKCWSRGCDERIGPNFIHLIKWALTEINPDTTWGDVSHLVNGGAFEVKERSYQEKTNNEPIPLMDPLKYPMVTIPSVYYIDRGFSPEILIKYGVGDAVQFPFTYRSLVPIKTEGGALMGFSGRSQHKICKKCDFYHSKYESCIAKDYKYAHMYKKWFHSSGLKKMRTLYGICEVGVTDKIAIVEGVSCVWKLSEVGIAAAAVLGSSLSKEQGKILKRKGIKKVLILSDEDEAGYSFKDKFINNYYTEFEIHQTKLPKKDVSEMCSKEIEDNIIKKWNKI